MFSIIVFLFSDNIPVISNFCYSCAIGGLFCCCSDKKWPHAGQISSCPLLILFLRVI